MARKEVLLLKLLVCLYDGRFGLLNIGPSTSVIIMRFYGQRECGTPWVEHIDCLYGIQMAEEHRTFPASVIIMKFYGKTESAGESKFQGER